MDMNLIYFLLFVLLLFLNANCVSLEKSQFTDRHKTTPLPFPHLKRPIIISHRGTRLLAPENAFPAFDLALYFGTDVLETDVRLTKDNQLVIFHDETLERVANSNVFVRNLTVSELKTLDNAYHFQDAKSKQYTWRGKNVTIPTLNEFLERYWTKKYWISINIEIKDEDLVAGVILANILSKYPLDKVSTHLNVVSRFCPVLELFRNKTNFQIPTSSCESEATRFFIQEKLLSIIEYPISWIFKSRPIHENQQNQIIFSSLFNIVPNLISRQFLFSFSSMQVPRSISGGAVSIVTPHYVRNANRFHKEVHVWVINSEKEMKILLDKEIGVHSLITDRTDVAVRVYESYGRVNKSHKELLPNDYIPYYSLPDEDLNESHECVSFLCLILDNSYLISIILLSITLLLCSLLLIFIIKQFKKCFNTKPKRKSD